MFSQFLSSLSRHFTGHLTSSLDRANARQHERERLTDAADDARLRRRLAVRAARERRRSMQAEDRQAFDRQRTTLAGSGLRLGAGSAPGVLIGEARRRGDRRARASSVVREALADRLARAALRRGL